MMMIGHGGDCSVDSRNSARCREAGAGGGQRILVGQEVALPSSTLSTTTCEHDVDNVMGGIAVSPSVLYYFTIMLLNRFKYDFFPEVF